MGESGGGMDVGQITVDEEEYAAIEMALSQVACFSQILGARAPCSMGTVPIPGRKRLGTVQSLIGCPSGNRTQNFIRNRHGGGATKAGTATAAFGASILIKCFPTPQPIQFK